MAHQIGGGTAAVGGLACMIALLVGDAQATTDLWGQLWFQGSFSASALCMLVGLYVLLSAYLPLPMVRTLEQRRESDKEAPAPPPVSAPTGRNRTPLQRSTPGPLQKAMEAATPEEALPLTYAEVTTIVEQRIREGLSLAQALDSGPGAEQTTTIHAQVTTWEQETRFELRRFHPYWAREFGEDGPELVAPHLSFELSDYVYGKLHRLAALLGDDYDPQTAGAIPAARIEHRGDCPGRQVVGFEEQQDGRRVHVWRCEGCGASVRS